MANYCEVIFPLPLFQTFLYRLPEEMTGKVGVGSRVVAPLGKRKLTGYVLEIKNNRPEPGFRVKEIIDCLDDKPVWSESFIKFILALSDFSLSPPGLFMKLSEPPSRKQKSELKVRLTEKGQEALTSGKLKGRKQDLISLLAERQLSPLYLKRKLGIKDINPYLKSLEENGFVEIKERVWKSRVEKNVQKASPRQLSLPVRPEGESEAEKKMLEKIVRRENDSFLLSGSQKKRQKLLAKLIDFACQDNGLVLVLVPEIQRLEKWRKLSGSLTSPHILWHSQLKEKEKRENWALAVSGEVRVVFGTRSALFLPVQPLSLIIIDEEQDDLYYQTEGPVFDAREAAEIRAKIDNSLVIFSSGCPGISRYYHHREKGTLINLGEEKPSYNLSFSRMGIGQVIKRELKEDLGRQLATENQSLFFVNRKGYAGYLFCPSCGFVPRCQKCRIALSLKKKNGELTCGYCGEISQALEQCPICGKKLRPGRIRGSQYLKEQLSETFPEQAVEVLEEGLGDVRIRQIARKVRSGKTKLLVGTEYAIDHLPEGLFSLVVLINPENSLNLPDFRASERTFATIYKLLELVKNDTGTKVVAVVTGPEPEVIRQALSRNYEIFFEQEIDYRNLLNYPPFSCLVEVNLKAGSLRNSARRSRQLLEKLRADFPALEIIGPRITRQMWRREKKEIKLFLRLISQEKLAELLALLKEFRQRKPTTYLTVRIWK